MTPGDAEKLTIDQLQQRRDVLELALASAEVGTWDWDVLAQKSNWDTCCKALFGLPPDAAIKPGTFIEMVHPEDRAILENPATDSPDTSDEFRLEFRVIRTDGQTRWVSSRGRIFRDATTRKAIRVAGVTFDITDRKLAEESLRASGETLDLAMDVAEMGTWILDIAGGPGDWDQRGKEDFWRSAGCAAELSVAARHAASGRARRAGRGEPLGGDRRRSKDYSVEYRINRPDGQVRWISSRGRVVRDENGTRAILR